MADLHFDTVYWFTAFGEFWLWPDHPKTSTWCRIRDIGGRSQPDRRDAEKAGYLISSDGSKCRQIRPLPHVRLIECSPPPDPFAKPAPLAGMVHAERGSDLD